MQFGILYNIESRGNKMNNTLTLVDEIQQSEKQTYCSIPLDTVENKKKVFKISEKADGIVKDILDKPIKLKDLFIQKFDKVNDETGEIEEKVRLILIDSEGKSYASASKGLYRSILKLCALIGLPETWENPIDAVISETATKNGGKTYVISPII